MSTLELIWDAHTRYKLWSWTNGSTHYVAHVIRRLNGRPHIFTVRIGARGTATVPTSNTDECASVAVVKMASTPEAAEALAREAQVYAQLAGVQGIAVPRCFGHFHGRVGGKEVVCLVLEYCAGFPGEQMQDPHRQIMFSAYALHAQGIMHGDLLSGRHFVKSGRAMMILDFAAAVPHHCLHGKRVLGPDGRPGRGVCPELAALEQSYGVYRRSERHSKRGASDDDDDLEHTRGRGGVYR
ncbi:hypothetical protein GGX14DRAFT_469200 [Mycena pura]|uniref:Protein kinase domain-containing protein n=1 Tax=Mycena pura TaxID=153505 RepID=A0AAD6Y6A2_9AGAR|nr:hypothetical protein GGX14DRAFT_469200 [Mycena pura]